MVSQLVRLIVSCVILGVGVAMLLIASLGSDGYSTMINGFSIKLEIAFWVVNLCVGILLVAMAWARGLKPGIGTITQPIVVGLVVSGLLESFDQPVRVLERCSVQRDKFEGCGFGTIAGGTIRCVQARGGVPTQQSGSTGDDDLHADPLSQLAKSC